MAESYQMKFRPRGYRGLNHETLGSDVLAVMRSLKLPHLTLGQEMADRLSSVKANEWYPIGMLLEATERVEEKLGNDGLRQMGRVLFKTSHESRGTLPPSARALLYAFDTLYRTVNRGEDIGGWKVIEFSPGLAKMEKTTPHHCIMEEGIMGGALQAVRTPATITQERCMRKGADHCLFVVSSFITDQRWG
jgi:hypothetical protein